jgi:hypothetical protein
MKLYMLILILFLAVVAQPALPQQASAPLTKGQVMDFVKFGMDSTELAKIIKDHGIDFEPTDDDLDVLRKAGAQEVVIQAIREVKPKPLTREQVGELVAGGVPSERAVMLVKQRGIDFLADDRYLQTVRLTGGDDTLAAALREASAKVKYELVVETDTEAEVYLDETLQGRADASGNLAIKARPGEHTLKVSKEGWVGIEEKVTLSKAQGTSIIKPLLFREMSLWKVYDSKNKVGVGSVTLDYRSNLGVTGYRMVYRGHDLKESDLKRSGFMELLFQVPNQTTVEYRVDQPTLDTYMFLQVDGRDQRDSINLKLVTGMKTDDWFEAEIPMSWWAAATHLRLY